MSHHTNIVRIIGVYNALEELKDSVVFVGGATVSLYADKPEQADVRVTDDIDVLIEIGTYSEYATLQEKLMLLKFELDTDSKIICRYKYQGLIVDIMPTAEHILGFSNKWYRDGFANIMRYQADEYTQVNIFKPAYFLASKLEAFNSRGNNDGRTSHDFEDIIFLLDNRQSIWEDLKNASNDVKRYLKIEFERLIAMPFFEEWVTAHLEYNTSVIRGKKIMDALIELVSYDAIA